MNSSFKLSTYNPAKKYAGFHFFVLNKGLNSGKPLLDPCTNCFVCSCNSLEDKENLYWIFFALWNGKRFHQLLIGSVIPFIKIKETKNLVQESFLKTKSNPAVFQKALNLLKLANEKDLHFQNLALTIRKIKIELAAGLVS
jgi:hypothetical protein